MSTEIEPATSAPERNKLEIGLVAEGMGQVQYLCSSDVSVYSAIP